MAEYTWLIIFNIFLIGLIAIIIVKLYYRNAEGKDNSENEIDDEFSFSKAISSKKEAASEHFDEDKYFKDELKPQKPPAMPLKGPTFQSGTNLNEPAMQKPTTPRQQQVPRQNPASQKQVPKKEEKNTIYSFDKVNFADRPTGITKTQEPITNKHRDIMNNVEKIVKTEEARIEEDLKKKEENGEDSELKDLFTIDELIKESKRKDEERKIESEMIQRKSDEIKGIASSEEETNNDALEIAETKEEIDTTEKITDVIEQEAVENEDIKNTLKESDEVIGTPHLKSPTKIETSINDVINDTVEEEKGEKASSIKDVNKNKKVPETKNKDKDFVEEIEVITPNEDDFGTPIEETGLFDEEVAEEREDSEYNEYNDLDYRKDLNKIKDKVKGSKLFNDVRNKIQEYKDEKEENTTANEEDFIRNISYYNNDSRYSDYNDPYASRYETIEPIASEQQIREENTRNLINITRGTSTNPVASTKKEEKSAPVKKNLKIMVNNNEVLLKKNDEIIFKYNGDTYSSKVYSIVGNDITVKFRGKRIKIKPSDIKKVF